MEGAVFLSSNDIHRGTASQRIFDARRLAVPVEPKQSPENAGQSQALWSPF